MCSNFYHHRVATSLKFFRTKLYGNIPTGNPLTGASNGSGAGRKIAIRGSMAAVVRSTIATVNRAVYRVDRHASVNLVYHMDDYAVRIL